MTLKRLLLACLLLGALAAPSTSHAAAAGATPTTEDPTPPRAVTLTATGTGTAQQTLTLTCPAGNYIYLVTFEEFKGATTAPAATLTTTTTTNLGGKKWYGSVAATATEFPRILWQPAQPLKSTANTATIVSNAAITNVNYGLSADYFCAP